MTTVLVKSARQILWHKYHLAGPDWNTLGISTIQDWIADNQTQMEGFAKNESSNNREPATLSCVNVNYKDEQLAVRPNLEAQNHWIFYIHLTMWSSSVPNIKNGFCLNMGGIRYNAAMVFISIGKM